MAYLRYFNDLPRWASMLDEMDNQHEVETTKKYRPLVNIFENNDNYRLEIVAPGFTKEAFHLQTDRNELTISAERSCTDVQDNVVKKEFILCSLERTFILPETADKEQITAKYDAGIMSITIPKREEAKVKPPRQIEIS